MSEEFLKYWNLAKEAEEKGHEHFQKGEYQKAAEYHKKASDLFKKLIEFIDIEDEELRKKSLGNYYIELANHYHSIAAFNFYSGVKQEALRYFQSAIEEHKKSLHEYETLVVKKHYKHEVISLKVTLHLYLTYENICLAQIAFLNENYPTAVEYFKIAEIHTNLELEFIAEIGDIEGSKRVNARRYYIKGQTLRAEALLAMQNTNRKEAREKYLMASKYFEDAASFYPEWEEYQDLARKSKKMAMAIRE